MAEQALASLKKAIDALGPNMWVQLDAVSFPRSFGVPLRKSPAAHDGASLFAKLNCYVLSFDAKARTAKFCRAQTKEDRYV